MARFTKAQQDESREAIKGALVTARRDRNGKPIIYTILRSVSRSGMMRKITVFTIDAATGCPISLSWHYDRAHGRMADDSCGHWANKVPGCGMDMGFHLAYNLASMGEVGLEGFTHEWF